MRWFSPKVLLLLAILIGSGYLSSKFPDEAVLIFGCSAIIVIGFWVIQAQHEQRV